jgi:hypothetical protein
MQEWKWPAVAAFGLLLAAIVAVFGLANDQDTRNHIIDYLDAIVPFIVGAAAGGTVAGATGYLWGFAAGQSGR